MRNIRRAAVVIFSFLLAFSSPNHAYAVDGNALLTACANSINDPLYTTSTIPTLMAYADSAALAAAITSGTVRVWIASGSGNSWLKDNTGSAITDSTSDGSNIDLFCGNGNDNSVATLDSSATTYDYFFGGAGNDQVTSHMWHSKFYGGEGDDYVANLDESSLFEGGPGADSYGVISTGTYASTFNQGADIIGITSFSIAGNVTTAKLGTVVVLTSVVTAASKITFKVSGKRIANCINRVATGSASTFTATCNWKPTYVGYVTLSLTAVPTGAGTSNSATMSGSIFVSARTGNR